MGCRYCEYIGTFHLNLDSGSTSRTARVRKAIRALIAVVMVMSTLAIVVLPYFQCFPLFPVQCAYGISTQKMWLKLQFVLRPRRPGGFPELGGMYSLGVPFIRTVVFGCICPFKKEYSIWGLICPFNEECRICGFRLGSPI